MLTSISNSNIGLKIILNFKQFLLPFLPWISFFSQSFRKTKIPLPTELFLLWRNLSTASIIIAQHHHVKPVFETDSLRGPIGHCQLWSVAALRKLHWGLPKLHPLDCRRCYRVLQGRKIGTEPVPKEHLRYFQLGLEPGLERVHSGRFGGQNNQCSDVRVCFPWSLDLAERIQWHEVVSRYLERLQLPHLGRTWCSRVSQLSQGQRLPYLHHDFFEYDSRPLWRPLAASLQNH